MSARCLSGLHFRVWRRGVSMTAVTVECDEKSMVDRAREWGHSPLPHKAESNDVGCSSAPLLEKREGAHPQLLFGQMLKDKPAFYLPEKVAHPPGIQYPQCSELPTVCTCK